MGPGALGGFICPYLSAIFSPFSLSLGAPYFSFYAAALWGTRPLHLTLVAAVYLLFERLDWLSGMEQRYQ